MDASRSTRDPAVRHLVLLGGGHAHVHVLRAFGSRPEPGVRLTLIAADPTTLYSGLLPGVVAGLYHCEQARIDLRRLAAGSGAEFMQAEAIGLDRARKCVLLTGLAPVRYDILSVDVGAAQDVAAIAGADQHAIPVAPMGSFLIRLQRLLEHCRTPDGPRRLVVIGGGAGGIELLLALRARVLADADTFERKPDPFSFTLVTAGEILPTHNRSVRCAFGRLFAARDIVVVEQRRVSALEPRSVCFDDGGRIAADAVVVATGAAPRHWFSQTGLMLDGGFIAVGPTLQSRNDPDVFAAGDCAALATPRERAGVYAVRAGPPLARNLRRHLRGEPLRPWMPPSRHLALISTGERCAVASWGPFTAEGAWVWRLKDCIDRRWMRRFQIPG